MKVYTCTEFRGFWPVGTSAVVVAAGRLQAARLLEDKLAQINLAQTIEPANLVRLDIDTPGATILQDGDY